MSVRSVKAQASLRMRRLACAFAARLCDRYRILMELVISICIGDSLAIHIGKCAFTKVQNYSIDVKSAKNRDDQCLNSLSCAI